jgi:tRNA (guanine-N7-)-methyltransferase
MGKNKLERWAEMAEFPHVFQFSGSHVKNEDFLLKGKWAEHFFKNNNPLVLELGCGKGEYTVGLARRFPNKNFIGIDIKGARIWRGAKISLEEGLKNVAFLRARIDFINHIFSAKEVDEIWLTFSDPQPRVSKAKKRLTSPDFLQRYSGICKKNAIIHMKSDSDLLYEYTREVIRLYKLEKIVDTGDLYGDDFDRFDSETREILDIRTFYEQIWLEKKKKIKYLKFILPEGFKKDPSIKIEVDPALAELEKLYKQNPRYAKPDQTLGEE